LVVDNAKAKRTNEKQKGKQQRNALLLEIIEEEKEIKGQPSGCKYKDMEKQEEREAIKDRGREKATM